MDEATEKKIAEAIEGVNRGMTALGELVKSQAQEQLQTTEASISALEQRLTDIRTEISTEKKPGALSPESMEMFVGMDVSSMENLKVIPNGMGSGDSHGSW
jgi:hypothetical protein